MEKKNIMAQELFEAMVDGAIDDLRDSGLDKREIFNIIEGHFGLHYTETLCNIKPETSLEF
jgi:hypothetical protein